ncbi:MAG: ArsB/NhaD family transporter [Alphaproteobacteria bacterium]|nr:ArsB/NhaD family transporter [Alphaproteobacteria bacterium]
MSEPHAATTIFGADPFWLSTAILAVTYLTIMTERINRSVVALLGAGVVIVTGLLSQEEAIRSVDFNTIGLLTGMMIIVAITRKTGVFEYVAVQTARLGRASPPRILLLLAIVTAVLSAFLDNVTTVLLVAPVTLALARDLKVPPYPFLFAEILASNIGGTATLIGDPPNILIGSLVGLSFNQFVVNLAPVVIVTLAVQCLMIHALWGRRLFAAAEDKQRVLAQQPRAAIKDVTLLRYSLGVIAAVVIAFVLARWLGLEPGTIAMLGAALLLLLDNYHRRAEEQTHGVHESYTQVEWITIFFFVGLFIVVAGVEHAGVLGTVADGLFEFSGGDLDVTAYATLWVSAILSSIIDNIPFVATMIPVIKSMAPAFGGPEQIMPLWWALSLGACFGGNGTLIGASANLTVAGIAERSGVPFRFLTFLAYAFPMMLVSIAIAHLYIWLRYF